MLRSCTRLFLASVFAVAAFGGCAGSIGDGTPPDPPTDDAGTTPVDDVATSNGPGGQDGSSTTTLPDGAVVGIPGADGGAVPGCPQGNEAIQAAILAPRCGGSCHGASAPQGGLDLVSPNVAARLANVTAHTCAGQVLVVPNNPDRSFFFHKVIDAMPACGSRMPVGAVLSVQEIACLRAWIADGLQPTPADAGTPPPLTDAGAPMWMPTPGSTPVCTSGGSSTMCPGSDCMSCHRAGGRAGDYDKRWTIAGTLFSSATSSVTRGVSGAQIVITDATGAVVTLTTNSVGNFYTLRPVTFPAMAEIHHNGTVERMPVALTSGSCNGCHILPSAMGTSGRLYISP